MSLQDLMWGRKGEFKKNNKIVIMLKPWKNSNVDALKAGFDVIPVSNS